MSRILVRRNEGVLELCLNNPDAVNALASGMVEQLLEHVRKGNSDPTIGAVLLTGKGKGFCAGADLSGAELTNMIGSIEDVIAQTLNPLITEMITGPKPTVCALNGVAAGAGVGIALASDIVIASRSASVQLSFVKIAAVLDAGTSFLVQELAGRSFASAMAMLAAPVSAQDARTAGLIWKVVEDDRLMAEARAVALALSKMPRQAIGMIKRQLRLARHSSPEKALRSEAEMQGKAFETSDFLEGVSAFQQKRSPIFGQSSERNSDHQ